MALPKQIFHDTVTKYTLTPPQYDAYGRREFSGRRKMGESSLLTVSTAERRAHKDRSGAVSKQRPGESRSGVAMDVRERSRSENMGLNRGDRR
ncbi:hypothetical protein Zmor_026475 [Zophobas morio]|uniref:Uncharacterized protein n=1 Tax=Zophobas morio TaxID=2755281 RepID=A0AA38HVC9_9CUCU|nr:hypothetical protein Zmor_026475 [Zophobas morio]